MRGILASLALVLGARAACHVFPASVNETATAGDVTAQATDGGLVVEGPGWKRRLTTCDLLESNTILSVRASGGRFYFVEKGNGIGIYDPSTNEVERPLPDSLDWVTALDVRGPVAVFGVVRSGLYMLEGDEVSKVDAVPDVTIRTLAVLDGGSVVYSTDSGVIYRLDEGAKPAKLASGLHPTRIVASAEGLEVSSIFERCTVSLEGAVGACSEVAPPDGPPGNPNHITSLASYEGRLHVGTFDDGLHVFADGGLDRVFPDIRFVNALLVHGDRLLVGAREGLFVIRGDRIVDRREWKVNGLSADGDRIVVATKDGVDVLDRDLTTLRHIGRSEIEPGGAPSLALVYGGSVHVLTNRGITVVGPDGSRSRIGVSTHDVEQNWATAAAPFDGDLFVGTYSKGLYRLHGSTATTLSTGLWVNPDGLRVVGDTLYVLTMNDGVWKLERDGSLGKLDVDLPSRDATSIAVHGDALHIGTRDGLASIPIEGSPPAPPAVDDGGGCGCAMVA